MTRSRFSGVDRSRRRGQRGTAALELTLVTPVLILILLFVVGLGRLAHARQQVEAAASDSAREASLHRGKASAEAQADVAARRSLGQLGMSCRDVRVAVDLGDYQPGGVVSVTVACRADLSDVALAGFPGSKVLTATSVVPIETFRVR